MDGDPYLVLTSAFSKKDRQKASNYVKMKNLRTGGVVDRTFHMSDVLEEANIATTFVFYGSARIPEPAKAEALLAAAATPQQKLIAERLRATVNTLQESLDYLRLSIKYLVFDLEATRRENTYLRKMLEETTGNE